MTSVGPGDGDEELRLANHDPHSPTLHDILGIGGLNTSEVDRK